MTQCCRIISYVNADGTCYGNKPTPSGIRTKQSTVYTYIRARVRRNRLFKNCYYDFLSNAVSSGQFPVRISEAVPRELVNVQCIPRVYSASVNGYRRGPRNVLLSANG